MKIHSKSLKPLIFTFSLFTINFTFSEPAKAAIACEPNTINHFQNGSLASCILSNETQVQLNNPQAGISNFPCKAKNYILFLEDGQFQSCQLSNTIQIRTGNSVQPCPAEYMIYVSVSKDGNQSISCQSLR
ncbi:MAG: hypothetical protein DSM106950_36650 [Stigonema ocellatum SAG 48.90 = DSM 106950]|nr:hypothetical protein [Stigonema ocellatum SAG 48.90 = DSM 106950]